MRSFVLITSVFLIFLPSPLLHAQTKIGTTLNVKNNVTGTLSSATRHLKPGMSVYRNERVRAGTNSRSTIEFVDKTQLVLGPNSSLVLSKFVYAGNNTTNNAVVRMARGVFRFISGGLSESSAYKIQTPAATIGIRGTVVDVHVRRRGTSVLLVQGLARVCSRRSGACRSLSPCQHVYINGNGRISDALDRSRSRAFPFASGTYGSPKGQGCFNGGSTQNQDSEPEAAAPVESPGEEAPAEDHDDGKGDDHGGDHGGGHDGGYGEGEDGEGKE